MDDKKRSEFNREWDEHRAIMAERDAIGRRIDARLDSCVRRAAREIRRERVRRQKTDQKLEQLRRRIEKLAETVDRYIRSCGNGRSLN